jgi:AraC-like DNA-binding protein
MSDLLKKQTGKSAQELIHQQLIEKAKYLLLNSDESVASIAYQLGFEYPQYFSRIFKKKTTMTPQQFRQLH